VGNAQPHPEPQIRARILGVYKKQTETAFITINAPAVPFTYINNLNVLGVKAPFILYIAP
jgi:hypothetical protein